MSGAGEELWCVAAGRTWRFEGPPGRMATATRQYPRTVQVALAVNENSFCRSEITIFSEGRTYA